MGRLHLVCLLSICWPAGWTGCSDSTAGCRFDVDCPGTQRCVEGVCRYPDEPEPCAEVVCQPPEICVAGACLHRDTDSDGDSWNVQSDCDDSNPAIHPGALEVCNQQDDNCDGQTDEELFCGQDCVPTSAPPALDPPAACDATTPCEQCYLYESTHYYCRDLAGAGQAWLALPQMTPCTSAQHCQTMTCQTDRFFHCDARLGVFLAGAVPTAEPEACNGQDDDCDGATDEPGAEALCEPREHASAACVGGACSYTCGPGTHDCAGSCADDGSPETCGDRCSPCQPPANSTALCSAGACDFECLPGHLRQADACLVCDRDEACGAACAACPPGTSCCGDGCYDLQSDPTHCGGCQLRCSLATDSCCAGLGCCAMAHPLCCGDYCCLTGDQCCPGEYCCDPDGTCCQDHCCPATYPNCCGTGCCAASDSCCNQTMCCPPSHPNCCPDGCCGAGYATCCGDGCCPDNTACCNALYCCDPSDVCCTDGCCPAAYPVCCPDGCCPAGTACCAQGCCPVKQAGLPGPLQRPIRIQALPQLPRKP